MLTATLGMYDLPEARRAIDAWWSGIAKALRKEGVTAVPDELVRPDEPQAHWSDPSLLLSQSCGYPLTHEYAGLLQPVATPCYAAPGCAGADYRSVIVVGRDSAVTELSELRNGVAAFNRTDSHSGYNALRAMVAPLARGRPFFSAVLATGSHEQSITAVASGRAHVAAVDCVSLALLKRYRAGGVRGIRELCFSMSAPGLPLVTRAQASPDLLRRLRAGLAEAMADPKLQDCREALLLSDIAYLDRLDYAAIERIERQALALDYPVLE